VEYDRGSTPISRGEVTDVVKQLHSGKAPGVDEIRPEMLKALGVEGLSWLARLTYVHEGRVMTERTRLRIQAAEMGFLRRVAGISLRDKVRSSVIREGLGVELLLLRVERSQLRWFRHLVRMPPGPREVFQARPAGMRPRGRPRTRWRDYISSLAWERLGIRAG